MSNVSNKIEQDSSRLEQDSPKLEQSSPKLELGPPLRIVFMGTPPFAAQILQTLAKEQQNFQLVAVYSQPDRPAGRGHKLVAPAVKQLAQELNLPVLQPLNFKNPEDIARLQAWQPDLLIVAAYGLILPQAVLDIPRLGPYNVHASLLPRYRGAAPIQCAIMNQDAVTGITIMRMELGLDSGSIVLQRAIGIDINDTTATLTEDLASLGAKLMLETIDLAYQNNLPPCIQQEATQVSLAPKITKQDGEITWTQSVQAIHAQIRAVMPWPLARTALTTSTGESLNIIFPPGKVLSTTPTANPGTVLGLQDQYLAIACQDGVYGLSSLTLPGKKPLTATQFWAGYGKQF